MTFLPPRFLRGALSGLGLGVFLWSACVAPAAEAKRVLVVHSFGNAAPPFTTHSVAFETELTETINERVDLDEIYLDVGRYATLDMEEALIELMRKRQAKWQPDLVVPIGSPAGAFVAQHRDRLFLDRTPIIYTGMDQRRLPPGALDRNAAFVGESFDLPAMVEDMLLIAPATTNIVVVIGASPLEQYWAEAFRAEWAPFTNRVTFTWLNDLPFDQMLERVAKLPPRSFIFLALLMRDASGVTHNGDEALKRIHAVANAPINSVFQHQLGLGIVGGRLYQAELEGIESARIAVRILRGESPTNFPPKIVGPMGPRYDVRELRRWEIGESHLPRGSTFYFRDLTRWERYKSRVIATTAMVLVEVVLIVVLLANLIKRRRAERSLVETEARFRAAADAAPVMMWMAGLDKLCVFLNQPWLDFTGRTLQQELGNGWAENVHADDLERCLKTYTEAFDARREFVMEYRIQRHDGEYRWISAAGKPRTDNQGTFVGYIGSCVDITETRRKTEALSESEGRLRAILDTAIEGIITVNEHGVIESVNAATEKIFGYTSAEMIGRNVTLLTPPPESVGDDQYLANYWKIHEPELLSLGREVSGRRKDGSVFPIELVVSELVLADRRVFTGFVRDISERRRAESESRELRSALAHTGRVSMLGQLSTALAHELSQPLGAILRNAEAAELMLQRPDPDLDELRAIIADILKDDQRAGNVIGRLRSLLKRRNLDFQPVELDTVISEVVSLIRSDVTARHVTLEFATARDLPPVQGDRVHLQQVLLNLIVNAFDALMGLPAGQARIRIQLDWGGPKHIKVSVSDNGLGLTNKSVDQLFEPFFTTKEQGMGMGLSVSKTIIEAHHGKIWAEALPKGGAAFHFTVPVYKNGEAA